MRILHASPARLTWRVGARSCRGGGAHRERLAPLRQPFTAAASRCGHDVAGMGVVFSLFAGNGSEVARNVTTSSSSGSFLDLVGNTPLVRLREVSNLTGCDIYGKCEFMNPGGSVKDRAARGIIEDAEREGRIRPGGVVVEGTAGNTGIGLALVSNVKGYKTVVVMPNTQSQEKKDMLRLAGAQVVEVPAVPYRNPNNYQKYAKRLAESLASLPEGAIHSNQFENLANRRAHYETTGPEIFSQLDGQVDGFICAIGTGGTLSGVGKCLKEKLGDKVTIGLVDPHGSGLYEYFENGEVLIEGSSITEGIGNSRVTQNLNGWGTPAKEGGSVDFWCRVSDEECMPYAYNLLIKEGLCVGTSSAVNVAGAVALAKHLGPGHKIVTILCDGGTRYQSKMFNNEFLKEKGLPLAGWLEDGAPSSLKVPDVTVEVEE